LIICTKNYLDAINRFRLHINSEEPHSSYTQINKQNLNTQLVVYLRMKPTRSELMFLSLIMMSAVVGVVVFEYVIAEAASPTGQCAKALKNSSAKNCHLIR